MSQSDNKRHDQNTKADKRIIRVIVLNALALFGCIAILLSASSCQQAVQMQKATTRLVAVEGRNHD